MKSNNFPLISTERLLLRELTDSDAEAIYAYLSDEDVIRYLEGSTDDVEEARGYINWCRETYKSKTDIRWGIELKENGRLIGDCGFGHIDDTKRPAELGYMVAREFWGHGYMTEALKALIDYGSTVLKLHRIQAWTHPDNSASARLLQKMGFEREGLLRDYIYIWHKACYIDAEMYSLINKDN